MNVTSVRLSSGTMNRLQLLAAEATLMRGKKVTASDLVREAIQELLDAKKPVAKEANDAES